VPPTDVVLPFGRPTLGLEEEQALLHAFRAGDLATGSIVRTFEQAFESTFSLGRAIAVSSGSMANLLAVFVLLETGRLATGDRVAVSGATFLTAAAPVSVAGLVPVFIDTGPDDVNMSLSALEAACERYQIAGALIPHALGQPLDLDRLERIKRRYGVVVIEDCCETLGATWRARPVGTVGDLATFSFYAGHHLTTAEGGMIVAANEELHECAASLRSFGRDVTYAGARFAFPVGARPVMPDERYVYLRLGFNAKLTDLQAAIGVEQLKRVETVLRARRATARAVCEVLVAHDAKLLGTPLAPGAEPFAIAFVPTRRDSVTLARALEREGIEVRSLLGASLPHQACYDGRAKIIVESYQNAIELSRRALLIGCPPVVDLATATAVLDFALASAEEPE